MKLRTLTTIGLPIRTELRLKSLLAVVDAKTLDQWSFSDGAVADVLICEPSSALSYVALKRSDAGAARCISLVKEGDSTALPGTRTLRDPVRVGDFIDLLNALSRTLDDAGTQRADADVATQHGDPFRFGTTLRSLARNGGNDVFMLDTGRFTAHVVPASRTVFVQQPLDVDTLRGLVEPEVAVAVMQYPASYADELLHDGVQRLSLDSLLWRIGLHGPSDRMLADLPRDAAFKLRRWPDFGRLEHSADHLRIAARLSRKETPLAELASSLGQQATAVLPFINACGLCELLKIVPGAGSELQAPLPIQRRNVRPAGILQSIRSVLGFGLST